MKVLYITIAHLLNLPFISSHMAGSEYVADTKDGRDIAANANALAHTSLVMVCSAMLKTSQAVNGEGSMKVVRPTARTTVSGSRVGVAI
jgi:hypothetical protein